MTTGLGITVLTGLIVVGIGMLVWLSPVAKEELTPAQENLINLSDSMVKIALGGVAGFVGGRSLPSR